MLDYCSLLQDVLGGVVDGVIPLDDDSVGVVKDALAILACKEIKLSSLRRYVYNKQTMWALWNSDHITYTWMHDSSETLVRS